VIRTANDPLSLTAPLRDLVAKADPAAVIHNIQALDEDVSRSVAQPRFTTVVLTGFAAIALGFAGVGLCSVLSYAVSRRRRELGVRAALGATRRDLIALVVREGVGTTLAGVIVGLVAAVILAGLLRAVLFGIGPLDAVSLLLAPAIILIVALVACALPARQAASIDPIETLKAE
jgi:putative ABC transport system permease protein